MTQTIASHETVDERGLLQDRLYIRSVRKVPGEPFPELINSLFKIRFERIDIIFSTRLVDAHSYEGDVETAAESGRASFESLKYGADLAVVNKVSLVRGLAAYVDD